MPNDGVPDRVPPGVLHTPGIVEQTLSHRVFHESTRWNKRGGNPATTRVCGVPFSETEWNKVERGLFHLAKHRGTREPEVLLTALLVCYWRGGVTQEDAAKLVGISKATFAELARLRRDLLIMERVVWMHFERAFNYQFPECDRRAVMRSPINVQNIAKSLARKYSDDALVTPPNPEPAHPRKA